MMQDEGAFTRLVSLISDRRDDAIGLYRMLLELLFEMARIQKLTRDDMVVIDDNFILLLFQLIEQLSDDAEDPYHYPIIRVLLVLNEQHFENPIIAWTFLSNLWREPDLATQPRIFARTSITHS
jgi:hypothetical protein